MIPPHLLMMQDRLMMFLRAREARALRLVERSPPTIPPLLMMMAPLPERVAAVERVTADHHLPMMRGQLTMSHRAREAKALHLVERSPPMIPPLLMTITPLPERVAAVERVTADHHLPMMRGQLMMYQRAREAKALLLVERSPPMIPPLLMMIAPLPERVAVEERVIADHHLPMMRRRLMMFQRAREVKALHLVERSPPTMITTLPMMMTSLPERVAAEERAIADRHLPMMRRRLMMYQRAREAKALHLVERSPPMIPPLLMMIAPLPERVAVEERAIADHHLPMMRRRLMMFQRAREAKVRHLVERSPPTIPPLPMMIAPLPERVAVEERAIADHHLPMMRDQLTMSHRAREAKALRLVERPMTLCLHQMMTVFVRASEEYVSTTNAK
jgi:hypothetical protein